MSKGRGRWQFTLKQLMGAVTAVALLLGLYYWTMTVDVCEVPLGTPVAQWCFGYLGPNINPSLTDKDIRPRNIARISGRFFAGGSHVRATLYLVENGKATRIKSLSVGESPDRMGTSFGEHLRITFALGDLNTPHGRVTSLGSVGETLAFGDGGWSHPHKVKSTAQHTLLTGRVGQGEARVVYAEGDQPPSVKFGMTIEDFAKRNPGSYLVVTMCLE